MRYFPLIVLLWCGGCRFDGTIWLADDSETATADSDSPTDDTHTDFTDSEGSSTDSTTDSGIESDPWHQRNGVDVRVHFPDTPFGVPQRLCVHLLLADGPTDPVYGACYEPLPLVDAQHPFEANLAGSALDGLSGVFQVGAVLYLQGGGDGGPPVPGVDLAGRSLSTLTLPPAGAPPSTQDIWLAPVF